MARINTPEQLKNHILSRLGSPVHTVEITEYQVYECIDRAVELFVEYLPEGTNKFYAICKLTETEANSGLIIFDKPITAITKLMVPTSGANTGWYDSAIFDANWHQNQDIVENFRSNGMGDKFLSDYEIYLQFIELHKNMFNPDYSFNYNMHRRQLQMFDSFVKDQLIAVEGYVASTVTVGESLLATGDQFNSGGYQSYDNPLIHSGVSTPSPLEAAGTVYFTQETYNDRWLKDMATAFAREQWAINLEKYDGVQLPGGVTINSDKIAARAERDIDKLREELITIEAPFQFWMA